jgi:hypothetical protein
LDALTSDFQRVSGERDAARADANKARAEIATLTGRCDALTSENASLKKENSQERVDSLVKSRMHLLEGAKKIAGKDVNFDGESDRAIMVAALTAHDSKFDAKDRTDEYLRADALANLHTDAHTTQRTDADTNTVAKAAAEFDAYARDAYLLKNSTTPFKKD